MIKNIKAYQDKLLSTEREKSEMDIASNIQQSLIPTIKENPYYEISAQMIPAEDVGGDYYDIIYNNDGKLWVGIGDVSGHGLASGLIMMMVQTAFNTVLLSHPDIAPSVLVKEVNRVAYQNIKERLGSDHFMTTSFLEAMPDGNVKFAGAHLDILVYRQKTKEVERIQTNGIWLGIIPEYENTEVEGSFKLTPGDTALLYTDGLIEAMDEKNEQYDMNRLMTVLKKTGHKNVTEIKKDILDDIYKFMHKQADDITLTVFRKNSE